MYLKIHQKQGKRIVAICDKEIIGKKIVGGDLELDLELYSSFYKGEITNETGIIKALNNFDSINVVGVKSVGLCVKIKLGSLDDVRYINKVPMLQIYKV